MRSLEPIEGSVRSLDKALQRDAQFEVTKSLEDFMIPLGRVGGESGQVGCRLEEGMGRGEPHT